MLAHGFCCQAVRTLVMAGLPSPPFLISVVRRACNNTNTNNNPNNNTKNSYGWGLIGAAVAWDCVQATSLALMVACCVRHTRRQEPGRCTWPGWSGDALREWGAYIRMAWPSMIMICEAFLCALCLFFGGGSRVSAVVDVCVLHFAPPFLQRVAAACVAVKQLDACVRNQAVPRPRRPLQLSAPAAKDQAPRLHPGQPDTPKTNKRTTATTTTQQKN